MPNNTDLSMALVSVSFIKNKTSRDESPLSIDSSCACRSKSLIRPLNASPSRSLSQNSISLAGSITGNGLTTIVVSTRQVTPLVVTS